MFLKEIAEIVFVFEAAGVGNLPDGEPCLRQKTFCFLKPENRDVFRGSHTGFCLETPDKLNIGKTGESTDGGKIDFSVQVFADLGDGDADWVTDSPGNRGERIVFNRILGDDICKNAAAKLKFVFENGL